MKIPSTLLLGLLLSMVLRADFPVFASAGTDHAQPTASTLPPGWRTISVPGKAETRFANGPGGVIKVSALNSAGFLYRRLSFDAAAASHLKWRWRVDMAPPPTDQSMKGMDDRPLAVHVWFDAEPESASPWTLMERVGAWLVDAPLPGKVLTYVWGGKGMRGDSLQNPYLGENGRLIILRPGTAPNGQWFTESVNIAADFEKAFGYMAPRPRYIAISGDTDDKNGISMGAVADLAFTM
jgi:hypothetical protein